MGMDECLEQSQSAESTESASLLDQAIQATKQTDSEEAQQLLKNLIDMANNAVNWFEIPVADMDRAKNFYQNVFQVNLMELPKRLVSTWRIRVASPRTGGMFS